MGRTGETEILGATLGRVLALAALVAAFPAGCSDEPERGPETGPGDALIGIVRAHRLHLDEHLGHVVSMWERVEGALVDGPVAEGLRSDAAAGKAQLDALLDEVETFPGEMTLEAAVDRAAVLRQEIDSLDRRLTTLRRLMIR